MVQWDRALLPYDPGRMGIGVGGTDGRTAHVSGDPAAEAMYLPVPCRCARARPAWGVRCGGDGRARAGGALVRARMPGDGGGVGATPPRSECCCGLRRCGAARSGLTGMLMLARAAQVDAVWFFPCLPGFQCPMCPSALLRPGPLILGCGGIGGRANSVGWGIVGRRVFRRVRPSTEAASVRQARLSTCQTASARGVPRRSGLVAGGRRPSRRNSQGTRRSGRKKGQDPSRRPLPR